MEGDILLMGLATDRLLTLGFGGTATVSIPLFERAGGPDEDDDEEDYVPRHRRKERVEDLPAPAEPVHAPGKVPHPSVPRPPRGREIVLTQRDVEELGKDIAELARHLSAQARRRDEEMYELLAIAAAVAIDED